MTDLDLARELAAVGRSLTWPEPADLVDAVVTAAGPRRPSVRRRVAAVVAGVVAVVSGVLAVSPTARAVASDLVHLRGVHVERVRKLPDVRQRTGPLGRRVTLAEARRLALFPVAIPQRLGPPDEVWVAGFPEGMFVTLVYGSPRLLVTEFRGAVAANQNIVTKSVLPSTPVESVQVGDQAGIWIEGEHAVRYVLPNGQDRFDPPRLAGNTLLWGDGLVLYRLETTLGRDEAIAIGTSFGTSFR